MWRKLGIFLLACTGIGAVYLLFRTTFISPGNVGLIRNYWTGKYEILQPGYHCIISPFRRMQAELPGQNKETLISKSLDLHTADNIEVAVNIDTRFVVKDGVAASENVVGSFQDALTNTTQTELAAIITGNGYRFQHLSSLQPTHTGIQDATKTLVKTDKSEETLLSKLVTELLRRVNAVCSKWGLEVKNVQIVNMRAKDSKIQQEMERSATLQVAANNELAAKQIQVQTKAQEALMAKTVAEGEANAEIEKAKGYEKSLEIRTKADQARTIKLATDLKVSPHDILSRDMQIEIADKLAKTNGTLVLGGAGQSGMGTFGLFGMDNKNKLPKQVVGSAAAPAATQSSLDSDGQSAAESTQPPASASAPQTVETGGRQVSNPTAVSTANSIAKSTTGAPV